MPIRCHWGPEALVVLRSWCFMLPWLVQHVCWQSLGRSFDMSQNRTWIILPESSFTGCIPQSMRRCLEIPISVIQDIFLGNAHWCHARGTHFEATTCFTSSKWTLLGSYLSFARFRINVQLLLVFSLEFGYVWIPRSKRLGLTFGACWHLQWCCSTWERRPSAACTECVNSKHSKHFFSKKTAMAALQFESRHSVHGTWHFDHSTVLHYLTPIDYASFCSINIQHCLAVTWVAERY